MALFQGKLELLATMEKLVSGTKLAEGREQL